VPVVLPSALFLLNRTHELHMANAQGRREFVEADDRGVSPTLLETTNVLLAEPGKLGVKARECAVASRTRFVGAVG
jgi:hypothetical protein